MGPYRASTTCIMACKIDSGMPFFKYNSWVSRFDQFGNILVTFLHLNFGFSFKWDEMVDLISTHWPWQQSCNRCVTEFQTEKINYGSSLSLFLSLPLSLSQYRQSNWFQFVRTDVYQWVLNINGRRVVRKEVAGHLRRCKSPSHVGSTLEELVLVLSRMMKILKTWSIINMAAFFIGLPCKWTYG
jgi:hypothetical protein